MLPSFLQRFFWDTHFETIDRERNKNYIIARLLELGDEAAIAWLVRHYSQNDLRQMVLTGRDLSPKSRHYWKFKYHVA